MKSIDINQILEKIEYQILKVEEACRVKGLEQGDYIIFINSESAKSKNLITIDL